MNTLNRKIKSSSKRISENRLNHLIGSKLKDKDRMLKAALTMDKIRNSYIQDKTWYSGEVIRKFRELK